MIRSFTASFLCDNPTLCHHAHYFVWMTNSKIICLLVYKSMKLIAFKIYKKIADEISSGTCGKTEMPSLLSFFCVNIIIFTEGPFPPLEICQSSIFYGGRLCFLSHPSAASIQIILYCLPTLSQICIANIYQTMQLLINSLHTSRSATIQMSSWPDHIITVPPSSPHGLKGPNPPPPSISTDSHPCHPGATAQRPWRSSTK